MEFKVRYVAKKKAQKIKNRQAAGFVRVKVRGRKRWVKGPAAVEKKAEQ